MNDSSLYELMPCVSIESVPNPNRKVFHLRHQLIDKDRCLSYVSDILKSDLLLPLTKPLVAALININGITDISIRAYEISIGKSSAYS